MKTSSLKKTAVATAVAGTFVAATMLPARADVVNFTWSGAFTILNPVGVPILQLNTDYVGGHYSDGDGYGYGDDPSLDGAPTVHGWNGHRVPVSGTLSFDFSNSAGVATLTPFQFFSDTPGSGHGTATVTAIGTSFQITDFTAGTMVGTMLFSWNGASHSLSFVMDASGLFSQLNTALSDFMVNGPTATIAGVGALPATNGIDFDSGAGTLFLPLGPSPIAMMTRDAIGCEAQPLATQANAWTINLTGNLANCNLANDDGRGGSPAASIATAGYNYNFDVMALHLDSYVPTPVPVPAAVWLFGSGLLGLIGLARRKKNT